jgi:uncharacterized DUF497 family protein
MKAKRMRGVTALCLIIVAAVLATSCARENVVPVGWTLGGSNPENYQVRIENGVAASGDAYVVLNSRPFLPSRGNTTLGFGTLVQVVQAQRYRNKRIAISALVKSERTEGWAGLWARADGCGKVLTFDNMMARPIRGTSGWRQYRVVVDVPEEATCVMFGVILNGSGRISIDMADIWEVLTQAEGFDWDSANAPKIWERHEVTPRDAEQVFFNRPLVAVPDVKHSHRKDRYYALGHTDDGRHLLVVFTTRKKLIRAISARDMSRRERREYQRAEEES